MGGQREIERKFAVANDFVLPPLVPGVVPSEVTAVTEPRTFTQEAVYYDSEDLRLARNHITLRRRTGGIDDGWHLKLPVRPGEREEIQRPLTDPDHDGSGPDHDGAGSATGATTTTSTDTGTATDVGTRTGTDVATGTRTGKDVATGTRTGKDVATGTGTDVGTGGGHRPPAELLDLVFVQLRGAAARPVARLVTTRTEVRLLDGSGAELAEVVDDEVSAQVLGSTTVVTHWREIEVELAGGDERLLDEVAGVLTAAGAVVAADSSKLARLLGPALAAPAEPDLPAPPPPPRRRSPAGDVLRVYLFAQVEALIAADPRVRLDEPDAVHKMRVATRRLRSTLRTFAPLFPADLISHLDGELRDLASALSGARDSEVQLAYFDGRLDALPADLVRGPIRTALDERLGAGQAAGRAAALAALRDERYLILLVDLVDLLRVPLRGAAQRPAHTVLPKLVHKADRRLARKVAAAAATEQGPKRDVLLHSARKQAKRLRYAAEALESVYGGDARRFAKAAEQAQELLGVHQDACVAAALLRSWGIAAQDAGEPTAFSFGLLLGLEDGRSRSAERDFFDAWPDLAARRHRRWLHQT
jgi:CHAD domain-containing protein